MDIFSKTYSISQIKLSILLLICFIYGTFSSSTPDTIEIPEIAIGALLTILIGLRGIYNFFLTLANHTKSNPFIIFLHYSFLYLITIPLTHAIIYANSNINDITRDIIALFFIFIPILLTKYIKNNETLFIKALTRYITYIGFAFSIRFLLIEDVVIDKIGTQSFFGDLNYFPIDPAVTFAAFFSMHEFFRFANLKKITGSILYIIISLTCTLAITGMLMRAPIIIYAVVLTIKSATLTNSRLTNIALKLTTLALLIFYIEDIATLTELIISKFQLTGLNAKDAEIVQLINYNIESPISLIFGTGWGGLFFSPAVGDWVRYIHNFAAYFLLKAGLIGLSISIIIIFKTYPALLILWIKSYFGNKIITDIKPSIFISCFATLSSSFFLQANYKSLSFGLVFTLTLISLDLFNNNHQKKNNL